LKYYLLAFRNYAVFRGRSTRREFWWFALVNVGVNLALMWIEQSVGWGDWPGDMGPLSWIYQVAVFFPSLSLTVRRLHDRGSSGWWVLIDLIPLVGWLILLLMLVDGSTPGVNRFGPNPYGDLVLEPDRTGAPPLASRKGRLVVCPWCGRTNPVGLTSCQWCRKPYDDTSGQEAFDVEEAPA
jgi:uncharacterized membrane protein YhaH (DUF805 family)